MHPKERYEEIITGKLAALPLPDMADAIWLRIERQLDIDLPTDDGGDVPEPPSPWNGGGGMAIGVGFLAVVGAILAFFYFKPTNQPTTNTTPINNTTEIQTGVRSNTATTKPASQTPLIQQADDPPSAANEQPVEDLPDAFVSDVAAAVPQPDSSAAPAENFTAQSGAVTPPLQPGLKSDTVPKKTRGLQNIGDKDYRIVPKNGTGQ